MMPPPSKVPIYPRPVEPLSAESVHFEPQDVIYASSYPSSDDDSAVRAAKRRRIEKLGEQYLRGDGLQVLSAGLHGPFDSSWKNPWARRRRDTKPAVAEIPETNGKSRKKLQTQKVDPAKTKISKVEDWLRRNSAYSGIQVEEPSSPTPSHTKTIDFKDSVLAKPMEKTTRDEPHELRGKSDSHPDLCQAVEQPCSMPPITFSRARRSPAAAVPLNHDETAHKGPIERRVWVSHSANADRAEFAALKSKRKVLEIAPPSTMLSPFEYRRVSDEAWKIGDHEEVVDGKQQNPASTATKPQHTLILDYSTEAPDVPKHSSRARNDTGIVCGEASLPPPNMTSPSASVPALVSNASRASLPELPSAQPQSLAVPAPSTNDMAIDERILERRAEPAEALPEPTRHDTINEARVRSAMEETIDQESNLTSKENQTPPNNKVLDAAGHKGLIDFARQDQGLNTQDMMAAISPMTYSTIKKTNAGPDRRQTPVTVTKGRPEKLTKTASFAKGERLSSDSSHGSLKMSLKVSKGCSSIAIGKENSLSRVSEEETHVHLSDLFTSPMNELIVPVASQKRLKSALKPSGPPISTAPFPSTRGSISTGIDGGQNVPVVDDDTFDLDGAIDDLGSYLGTWDAEKASLDIET